MNHPYRNNSIALVKISPSRSFLGRLRSLRRKFLVWVSGGFVRKTFICPCTIGTRYKEGRVGFIRQVYVMTWKTLYLVCDRCRKPLDLSPNHVAKLKKHHLWDSN